eukprot:4200510-Ditylum_brightwellii.AAC.1
MIKNDPSVVSHLENFQIYINLTNITAKKAKIQGFFVLSHGKYLNRKRAHNKLTQRLLMTQFDLHIHSCKHNYRRDTQAIAFVSDQAESRT